MAKKSVNITAKVGYNKDLERLDISNPDFYLEFSAFDGRLADNLELKEGDMVEITIKKVE